MKCGRWKTARAKFVPAITAGAKSPVHLVGESPGSHDKGPADRLLRVWMEEVGVVPQDCTWDSAVKCGPGTPTLEQIRLCRPFTLRNLIQIKPAKVLALGEKAAIALQNDGTAKVKRDRKRAITIPGFEVGRDSNGYKATVTYHPSGFLHGNEAVKKYLQDDLAAFMKDDKAVSFQIHTPDTNFLLDHYAHTLSLEKVISVDLEWSVETGTLLSAAFSTGVGGTNVYFPLGHRESKMDLHRVMAAVKKIMESDATKIGHNFGGDMLKLARNGVNTRGRVVDTFVLAKLIDENYPDKSLEHLAMKCLGFPDYSIEMRPFKRGIRVPTEERTKKGKIKYRLSKDYANAPLDVLGVYNTWDACAAYMLADRWIRAGASKQEWWRLYLMYMRALKILTRSSFVGFCLDLKVLEEEAKKTREEAEVLRLKLKGLVVPYWYKNRELRWKKGDLVPHDDDARDLLFKRMGFQVVEKTKGGQPSVDKKTLQVLAMKATDAVQAEICKSILALRKADKLLGTYMLKLKQYTWQDLFTLVTMFGPGYNIAGAKTGRLSSRPNVQNIPKSIRKAFFTRWRKRMPTLEDIAKAQKIIDADLKKHMDKVLEQVKYKRPDHPYWDTMEILKKADRERRDWEPRDNEGDRRRAQEKAAEDRDREIWRWKGEWIPRL